MDRELARIKREIDQLISQHDRVESELTSIHQKMDSLQQQHDSICSSRRTPKTQYEIDLHERIESEKKLLRPRDEALHREDQDIHKRFASLYREYENRKSLLQRAANLPSRQPSSTYPTPSRKDGYYSQMREDHTVERFIGPDGDITSERPHIHVVHSEREGKIIFVATQRDGSHTHHETLPITAPGSEVNAVINRLRKHLR